MKNVHYVRPLDVVLLGPPPMPEIVADLLDPSCFLLLSRGGIQESQSLGPDPFLPRACECRGGPCNRRESMAADLLQVLQRVKYNPNLKW
jgi:hypothetical protein